MNFGIWYCSVGLDDRGSVPRRGIDGIFFFSIRHCVQAGSGVHTASYTMGSEGSYPGGKAPGASSVEVQNTWNDTSTPQYSLMAWCLVNPRDKFTLPSLFYRMCDYGSSVTREDELETLKVCSLHWQDT